jgi:hypothetical protein
MIQRRKNGRQLQIHHRIWVCVRRGKTAHECSKLVAIFAFSINKHRFARCRAPVAIVATPIQNSKQSCEFHPARHNYQKRALKNTRLRRGFNTSGIRIIRARIKLNAHRVCVVGYGLFSLCDP